MRDKVQGLTNSGRNNQWKESFCRDKAHGRKMDNGSETLNMRKVNLEQAKMVSQAGRISRNEHQAPSGPQVVLCRCAV